jgi:hypothetical protein
MNATISTIGAGSVSVVISSTPGDRRLPRRHRQHDPLAGRNDRAGAHPNRRDTVEDAGLPQRKADADDQDEVPDEKKWMNRM